MLIRDIILEKGKNVVTIGSGQTINDAIKRLNQHRIGALVVTGDNDEIEGIITERDILMVCGEHCGRTSESPETSQPGCPVMVEDAMTRDIVIGVPGDDLNYAMGIMTKNRIRHLPVIENGQLAGIISIGDLVNAHFEEKVLENRTLREYIHGSGH
jgi:CBS domain-containing protein